MIANAFYAPLFTDAEVAVLFGTQATLDGVLTYERALTDALAQTGQVAPDLAEQALAAMDSFRADIPALADDIRRDGVPVPGLIRQLKAHAAGSALAIHRGATSQDVIDTVLSLALRALIDLMSARLRAVINGLNALVREYGDAPLMGRTRMQAALPITARHRIAEWRGPLSRLLDSAPDLRARLSRVHYAGPVGLQDGDRAHDIIGLMGATLDLTPALPGSHPDRAWVVEAGTWLSQITGALGKMGQDLALMAQQGLGEVAFDGGGASSAMPHKQNPVPAEVLVALARFNAVQIGGLHQALVHEQERSGAAWTLEWMILPQMAEATGAALTHAQQVLSSIRRIGG